jgi:alanine racemase
LATKLRDISIVSPSLVTRGGDPGLAPLSEVDIRTSIRPTVAVVDLAALRANAQALTDVAAGAAMWSVIKADAYGHGAVPVARALADVSYGLAVSLVEEGLELRAAGISSPILVLGASYGRHHDDVVARDLTPVVGSREDLAYFAAAGARRGRPVEVHIKLDTGMSRLGLRAKELPRVLGDLATSSSLRLAGVATHLACADSASEEPTREQLARFGEGLAAVANAGFAKVVRHAANSAATLRFPEARFDAVRPGLALYGICPPFAEPLERPALRPVLSLRTRVLAVREIAAGESVSYGWTWTARRPSRIGTLPIGYADGYPRRVTTGEVMVRGRRVPIVGTVCMDMLMVDLTDVPSAGVGDEIVLIGRMGEAEISLDEVAAWAGTISYEVLCGISKRVPRQYVE